MKISINILLKISLILIIVNCVKYKSIAQKTIVKGIITDASTKEPVPFVNISFLGTSVGTISESNGNFYVETNISIDSLSGKNTGRKYH